MIAIIVVNMYRVKVLIPSLPSVFTSLIDIMPEIIDTNISGNTIILSNIKKIDEIV